MLILMSLLGCKDPSPTALAVCEMAPGMYVDGAGLARLEPLLDPVELEILRQAEPTHGHQVLGAEGLAAIRSQTSCTVDNVNRVRSGLWAVALTQRMPSVSADGTPGPLQTHELIWLVVDQDGERVNIGLEVATQMRRSIDEAIEQDDVKRVTATWKAIQNRFPDPALSVNIHDAEAVEQAWYYRRKVVGEVATVHGRQVLIAVENRGETDINGADVTASFEVYGERKQVSVVVPALAAGQKTRVAVSLPRGASALRLKTQSVVLRSS